MITLLSSILDQHLPILDAENSKNPIIVRNNPFQCFNLGSISPIVESV